MRGTRTTRDLLLTVVVLATISLAAPACGTQHGTSDSVRSDGGGIVVSGDALHDGKGTVLDAIRGKVPNFRIRRDGGPCPRITLRNDASFMTQTNPLVYVDGTRANDTCVLESIQSRDVEAVEIYPRGVTTRPGYDMYAHGLILLFLRF